MSKEKFLYGDDKTIHRTGHVDVETNSKGEVVAVWFRCATLPFRQHSVDDARAREMKESYKENNQLTINAIEFLK